MIDDTQPEALPRYKIGYPSDGWGVISHIPTGIPDPQGAWVRYGDAQKLNARIAELESRVQELGAMARENRSRRIVELEAQLDSIRAGGVSGPLMGQPQAMPDLSVLTERGATAWAGVDAQGLREGVASAGSEPVEFELPPTPFKSFAPGVEIGYDLFGGADIRLGGEFVYVHINYDCRYTHNSARMVLAEQIAGILSGSLVTHPSHTEGMVGGWGALPGTLPEPGTPVLLDIGKKYPIRAMWAAKHTVEAADDDTDWGEYDEATETYYCPEGWYEWNEHEEIHWAVTETPRAWAPLPPTTPAGGGKGE